MKVILAGGGTGGHLYPGIAVAEELMKKEVEVLFLVSDRGIDRKILSSLKYNFVEQHATALKGKGVIDKIKSLCNLIKCVFESVKVIDREDKVLLLGGFAAASAGFAAVLKRADMYIHEQNSVMGFTNRFFARFAEKVFLSFEDTQKGRGKIEVTGNPVRKEIRNIKTKKNLEKNILVLGGSQGSRLINNVAADSFIKLRDEGVNVVHQTGENLFEETVKRYTVNGINVDNGNVTIVKYIDDMKSALEWCDVIVARAGSGTVFEIMSAKRPAILIPLRIAADNHQYFNALYFKRRGFGTLLLEDSFDAKSLVGCINEIFDNYDKYREKLESFENRNVAKLITEKMGII